MNADLLTNSYSGLLVDAGEVPREAFDPHVPMWSGQAASGFGLASRRPVGGIAWTRADAEAACRGEAVERWRAGAEPGDRAVESSFARWPLDERPIEPERWVLFHREQYAQADFPFRPFGRDTVVRWFGMRDALTGEPVWVPDELVFLDFPGRAQHLLAPGLSTGLSAGLAEFPLVLRGLQEVLERDAVVGAWWGRYALEEYAPDAVWRHFDRQQQQAVQRPNLEYRFYRIHSPYTAHAGLVSLTGEDRGGWCVTVGAACRESLGPMWQKALLEAIHCRYFVRYQRRAAAEQGSVGHCPRSFHEHALYYSFYPERWRDTPLARTARPLESEPASPSRGNGPNPGTESLASLAERLGPERPVLVRILTPSPLAQAGSAWRVVRVVVPGLQPLHGHHGLPFLGGPLWAPRGLAAWNEIPPHPFP